MLICIYTSCIMQVGSQVKITFLCKFGNKIRFKQNTLISDVPSSWLCKNRNNIWRKTNSNFLPSPDICVISCFPLARAVSIPQQGNPRECRDGSRLADIRAFIQRWKRYFFSFSSIWTEAYSMLRPIIHRNIFLRNVCSQSFQNIFLCKYFCVRSVFVPNKFISALTHWLDQRVINTISGWAKEDIIKKTIELDKYEIIMRIV